MSLERHGCTNKHPLDIWLGYTSNIFKTYFGMGFVTEYYFTLPYNNAMEEALLPPLIHKEIEDQRKKLLSARSHNTKKKKKDSLGFSPAPCS